MFFLVVVATWCSWLFFYLIQTTIKLLFNFRLCWLQSWNQRTLTIIKNGVINEWHFYMKRTKFVLAPSPVTWKILVLISTFTGAMNTYLVIYLIIHSFVYLLVCLFIYLFIYLKLKKDDENLHLGINEYNHKLGNIEIQKNIRFFLKSNISAFIF